MGRSRYSPRGSRTIVARTRDFVIVRDTASTPGVVAVDSPAPPVIGSPVGLRESSCSAARAGTFHRSRQDVYRQRIVFSRNQFRAPLPALQTWSYPAVSQASGFTPHPRQAGVERTPPSAPLTVAPQCTGRKRLFTSRQCDSRAAFVSGRKPRAEDLSLCDRLYGSRSNRPSRCARLFRQSDRRDRCLAG